MLKYKGVDLTRNRGYKQCTQPVKVISRRKQTTEAIGGFSVSFDAYMHIYTNVRTHACPPQCNYCMETHSITQPVWQPTKRTCPITAQKHTVTQPVWQPTKRTYMHLQWYKLRQHKNADNNYYTHKLKEQYKRIFLLSL